MGGEVVDVAAGFVGGGGTVDLIGGDSQGRRSVGDADSAAGGEDGGSAKGAGALLGAEIVDEITVEAERDDGGDAEALNLVECGGDVRQVVGGGGGRGIVLEHAEVGVRTDEAGDDGFAGAVDDGEAGGFVLRSWCDGFDEAGAEGDVDVLAGGRAGAVDEGGVAQDGGLLSERGGGDECGYQSEGSDELWHDRLR